MYKIIFYVPGAMQKALSRHRHLLTGSDQFCQLWPATGKFSARKLQKLSCAEKFTKNHGISSGLRLLDRLGDGYTRYHNHKTIMWQRI